MSQELIKLDSGSSFQELTLNRDPEDVLQEARKAAQALTRVISAKPKKVIINGEQYLEFSDWQLLGRFYGLTAKIIETKVITFGNTRGWEARAVILDRSGREVSAADAMCLNDEEKWSTKPKYEYHYVLKDGSKVRDNPPKNKIVWVDNPKAPGKKLPKKDRVKVADEPVPFFQLRNMAQTRAGSKAFRHVLSWVVVLAGYKPSSIDEVTGPEEEMPEEERSQETGSQGTEGVAAELLTEDQKNQIIAQLKKKNLALEHLEGYFSRNLTELKRSEANEALDWIAKQKPA